LTAGDLGNAGWNGRRAKGTAPRGGASPPPVEEPGVAGGREGREVAGIDADPRDG
jgi:hypothetical protein